PKRNLLPALIHAHRPRRVHKMEAITAPAPILRRRGQTTLHRIAVHIPQFLYSLLLRPNVEVIEAGLPEWHAHRNLAKQLGLAWIARFSFRQQGTSRALLQYLRHRRRSSDLRLAQQ